MSATDTQSPLVAGAASPIAIYAGDCRSILPSLLADSAQCVVTSPPYFQQRDYGIGGQIGAESTLDAYIEELVHVFRKVRRILRADGTLWLNLGDTWRAKQMLGVPWRVGLALQQDGWILRSSIIWAKPNAMPESVSDRPTRAHEYILLLTRKPSYRYDPEPLREPFIDPPQRVRNRSQDPSNAAFPGGRASAGGRSVAHLSGRNARSVWTINTYPLPEAHFATFPPALAERCLKAGSRPGDVVLDPFFGAGTVGMVASQLGRQCVGIEINPRYVELARRRLARCQLTMEGARG